MQAVLYISHGSRVEKARQEATTFLQTVSERVKAPLQEICFLELAEPDIAKGVSNLVNKGATKIAMIPVLLLSAGHYYKDIPNEIKKAKQQYPSVTFTYGEPIGVQDKVIDILVERILEKKVAPLSNASILLVGRGSYMPESARAIEEIARRLKNKIEVCDVRVCYLAACEPSFPDAIEASVNEDWSQIYVVPYLWFTGLLMRSVQDKINQLERADQEIIICDYLNDHPYMIEALTDRVHEALALNNEHVLIK
ncbi:sirohydrochlorin chelatase [Saliterribacillus persicus]|uniref:Sirohydrochlorin ferrochelatase n=1 Tax=Saliterribacillus persicus TaxID=930114 RepID=A0A368XDY0_9BACI|nr:sirohydrochlorin chelatase [Saliterribacillus persicus]RCW65859.1 sirohydrochlorin ferrochelatase [Saliterribacillus persicus]